MVARDPNSVQEQQPVPAASPATQNDFVWSRPKTCDTRPSAESASQKRYGYSLPVLRSRRDPSGLA